MSKMMGLYDPMISSKLKVVDPVIDPYEPLITEEVKNFIWKKRITAMVKTAKDTLTSQWAAPVILMVLLSFVVYDRSVTNTAMNKQLADQHDLLIKLETLHEVDEKNKAQENLERKEERQLDGVYREKMSKDFARLELIVSGKFPTTIKEN